MNCSCNNVQLIVRAAATVFEQQPQHIYNRPIICFMCASNGKPVAFERRFNDATGTYKLSGKPNARACHTLGQPVAAISLSLSLLLYTSISLIF